MKKEDRWDALKISGVCVLLILAFTLIIAWMSRDALAAKQAKLPSWEACKFIRAHDGDTFWCTKDNGAVVEVRLQSVDTPELAQKPFGQQAKRSLESLMTEGSLEIYCPGQTSYDRTVCAARVANSDVGTALLALGLACLDERYAKQDINRVEHLATLEVAQAEKVGLWSAANPLCGYDFRRKAK